MIRIFVHSKENIINYLGDANNNCVCGAAGTVPCSGDTPTCLLGICTKACTVENKDSTDCGKLGDFCMVYFLYID